MMASGEIRLSTMTMRQMPVLAQSPNSISMAPSADGFDPIVVTAQKNSSGSDVASISMDLWGAGAAAVETGWGEKWLATNGKIYSRFWANGAGKAYSIAGLSRVAGLYGYVAGEVFDWQSFKEKDITQTQFGTNIGLGAIGLASSTATFAVTPYILLNTTYPGGITGYYVDWTSVSPDTMPENPSGSAYVSFRNGEPF
jgi:hypothetical protein